MVEHHFTAYGVLIGVGVDCQALADTLGPEHLPFGWCVAEDHQRDAPVSVRYELLAGRSSEGSRSYRLYAGTTLVAEAAHSMPILKQAVSTGAVVTGVRGEARPLVSAILRHIQTPMLSTLLPR